MQVTASQLHKQYAWPLTWSVEQIVQALAAQCFVLVLHQQWRLCHWEHAVVVYLCSMPHHDQT